LVGVVTISFLLFLFSFESFHCQIFSPETFLNLPYLLMSLLKAFFISTIVFISSIYFLFFHSISIYLLTLYICLIYCLFFLLILSILIILKIYYLVNPTFLLYETLILMLIQPLQTGFLLLQCFGMFCWIVDMMYWVERTAINKLSVHSGKVWGIT
jgi:hypothetical protein